MTRAPAAAPASLSRGIAVDTGAFAIGRLPLRECRPRALPAALEAEIRRPRRPDPEAAPGLARMVTYDQR